MTKETLTSDKVNYIIWKYLIESGYEGAARHLSKEWDVQQPDLLPFAPHVGKHALVSVLNKGLLYDAYNREASRAFRQHQGRSQDVSDSEIPMGVFGPLEIANRTIPIITSPQVPLNNNEDLEIARKHQLEEESNSNSNSNSNGPPGKKPRLTNGYENGISNGTTNGNGSSNYYDSASTPMEIDVDQNGDGHAYPSPEQLPSPVTATIGPERGTQSEKVTNLKTETLYLDLLDDNVSKSTILYRCEWNPKLPNLLAAGGTESLARMWDLSSTVADHINGANNPNASGMNANGIVPPCIPLLQPLAPQQTMVNEVTWSSDGNHILVSSEEPDGTATVTVWTAKGQLLHTSSPMEGPVVSLKWNFSNTLFLTVSPITLKGLSTPASTLTVTSMADFTTIQHTIPSMPIFESPLEGLWMSDEDFMAYGNEFLQIFRFADGKIKYLTKYEHRDDHRVTHATFDRESKLLATGSQSGMIDIWDEKGRSRSFNAHTGPITSLEWQPLPPSDSENESNERLLASSSEDGAVSIWNAKSLEPKQKCSMTIDSTSVFKVKFTPDGAFIAGATSDRVFIWKVDDAYFPRATWNRPPGNGWQTPQSTESNGEDEHALSWDAHGQKLAYGCNSVLAIINFKR
ncbi:hypothetical protein BPAE_0018g00430 [Botrytis paeoniae]|uniref:LisH domain-containing protein n=1 Tax=Botrytis paeoniae TaxID=278948 RepID=A0A4Z1FXG2_9HELO|nr:hypothetical protein BPAE_0018g00430 [Botrytis paeoniae]